MNQVIRPPVKSLSHFFIVSINQSINQPFTQFNQSINQPTNQTQARKIWGGVVNTCRNLSRLAAVAMGPDSKEWQEMKEYVKVLVIAVIAVVLLILFL